MFFYNLFSNFHFNLINLKINLSHLVLEIKLSTILSGCGIIPKIFFFGLNIPAMFSKDPLGLDFHRQFFLLLQYLKAIKFYPFSSFKCSGLVK